ncbi:hypothetical protein MK852_23750 [Shewanella benthica]|uniref:hypothetical protein n=1 Tax=Shewanella benthica TaxID=43661 RepID=UPI0018791E0B|nr:hypothetical protein [Shewanella benthica]MBE7216389.1 hypothetical protein [Shewanella benthica]MCL1065109.1 hypothetical protein [Shewanella benthica]
MDTDNNGWGDFDTLRKLKGIPVSQIEKELAQVIDNLVDGKGKTHATIAQIDFGNEVGSEIEIKIKFSQR